MQLGGTWRPTSRVAPTSSSVRCSVARVSQAAISPYRVSQSSDALSAGAPEAAPPVAGSTAAPAADYPGPLDVARPPKVDWRDVVLFQGFGWESCNRDKGWWRTVESELPEIKGYLPSQLYDLNSAYGGYHDLVSLNTAALAAGIRPVVDVVINHRCADEQDANGVWNHFRDDVPHPGKRLDWGPWAITGDDPDYGGHGAADSGDDFGPSPDLDHSNEEVRGGLVDWLCWLRDYVGYEGLRIDFAKGFSPAHTREYVERALQPGVDLCVAEYWVDAKWNGSDLDYDQDGMRQALCDWINAAKYCAAFDFPTKAVLQEAVRHCQYDRLRDKDGKPPGLLGWWPTRAVTFVDNHDTGSTQQHWPFPREGVMQGYAYILTHPGMPTVFWEHYFDWGLKEQLLELLQLRQRAGIRADAAVEILAADADMYVARIASSVVIKLGPRFDMGQLLPDAAQGWGLAASGTNWAAWEKRGA